MIAVINTNRNYVLFEKETDYVEIINQRIQVHKPVDYSVELVAKNAIAVPDKPVIEKTGQLSLF